MTTEHQHNLELEPRLVEAYTHTFIPRTDMYPVQLPDGRYVSVKQPLSPSLITDHLSGRTTLGAYALDQTSHAKWLCFDADTDEQWDRLRGMAAKLRRQAVFAYLEPSRRGGHLWLFTSPLPGENIRCFGHQLLSEHGIEDVELFPKQDSLSTGPGSLVRLPLGIHRKTGKVYPFIAPDGSPLAPTLQEQLGLLANPQRVREPFISSVLSRASTSLTEATSPTLDLPLLSDIHGETLSERIKSAITVYDFVSQYVVLDQRGRGYCPFHDDEHKSFSINRQANFWNCFAGCGGGSLIDFWSRWREKEGQDPDFIPTITDLAEMLL